MKPLTRLFAEWSDRGAFVTIAEPCAVVARTHEALLAETSALLRDDSRLFTVVLDWLLDFADDLDVPALLAQTAEIGDVAALGVLADVARQQRDTVSDALERIVEVCWAQTTERPVEPFFHVLARHPYALKQVEQAPDPVFLRWHYLSETPTRLRDKVGARPAVGRRPSAP